ncbi:MAG: radical SAM protein [Chitinivibrionales bacterium]|nr:radical SAM protein [Chitinivibrionales bacterium]
MNDSCIFGPVASRRLGSSLGVDMTPAKFCTLNCVYCECGKTTRLTMRRDEYIPFEKIRHDIETALADTPELDVITFCGSGEPTLNTALGPSITYTKSRYPQYRTAVLTNATLLHDPQVRSEVARADLVLPSLDAVSQEIFEKINRPDPTITASLITEGLLAFAREYSTPVWLEIFIIEGINDLPDELHKFRNIVEKVNPRRIHLNSLDRPGTCSWVKPASSQRLTTIAQYFTPWPVEISSRDVLPTLTLRTVQQAHRKIITTIQRRPCTVEELSSLIGQSINQTNALLHSLIDKQKVVEKKEGDITFYTAASSQ